MMKLVKKLGRVVGIRSKKDVAIYCALALGVVIVMVAFAYGLEQSDAMYRETMGL